MLFGLVPGSVCFGYSFLCFTVQVIPEQGFCSSFLVSGSEAFGPSWFICCVCSCVRFELSWLVLVWFGRLPSGFPQTSPLLLRIDRRNLPKTVLLFL